MWRCFVRDQARVPSVAGAGSSLFRKTEQFFLVGGWGAPCFLVLRGAAHRKKGKDADGIRDQKRREQKANQKGRLSAGPEAARHGPGRARDGIAVHASR